MSHYNQHPRNLAFIVLYAMQNLVLLVATTGWYDDMIIATMGEPKLEHYNDVEEKKREPRNQRRK